MVAGERRSLDWWSNREDGDWVGARLRESLLVGAVTAVRQAIERRGQSLWSGQLQCDRLGRTDESWLEAGAG
jgi:hypothetical protein